MVKGINKQMIVLNIEGNRIYESACLVLKNDIKPSKGKDNELLEEANRILDELDLSRKTRRGKKGKLRRFLLALLLLIVGMAVGFALAMLL